MMMRKVYTTPAYFTMLLLKFFNLLLIFLSRPYVARNRCRFGWLAGGGFLVCGLFWVVSWGASGPLDGVDHWLETFPCFCPVSGLFLGASGPLDGVDHWLIQFRRKPFFSYQTNQFPSPLLAPGLDRALA